MTSTSGRGPEPFLSYKGKETCVAVPQKKDPPEKREFTKRAPWMPLKSAAHEGDVVI